MDAADLMATVARAYWTCARAREARSRAVEARIAGEQERGWAARLRQQARQTAARRLAIGGFGAAEAARRPPEADPAR